MPLLKIKLKSREVKYILKISRRARGLRLAVYRDGAVVVTAPSAMSRNTIEQFITQKSRWVIDKLEHFKKFSGVVFVKKNSKKDFIKYKEQALLLARNRVAYFNNIYNFGFNKINIRNQKTRWGSCSKKGSLNFNYKIALLPARLADYIIVHELCHLGEFNHSPNFWNLVAQTAPDYLEIRRQLKRTGINFY